MKLEKISRGVFFICAECGKRVTVIYTEEKDRPDAPWLCEECYEKRAG